MATRRYNKSKKSATRKLRKARKNKSSSYGKKKWITAVGAAQKVFEKTKSYDKARRKLRTQSLINARRLFGSVGEVL